MIKITGGTFRGKNIEVPASLDVPSKSMVRMGIMNAIQPYLRNARCLDLFAGSGALGLEALSRGAASCHFNDVNGNHVSIIRKNLASMRFAERVTNDDYLTCLESLNGHFDIVFLDPPYKMKDAYVFAVSELRSRGLVDEGSIIVMEFEGELLMDEETFTIKKAYRYGRTRVYVGNAK